MKNLLSKFTNWILVKLLDQPKILILEPPLWLQRAGNRSGQVLMALYGILDTIAWLCMGWVIYLACASLQLDITKLMFMLLIVLVIKIIR